jgi:hypothetical protein
MSEDISERKMLVSCLKAEICLFDTSKFTNCDWIFSPLAVLPVTMCTELLSLCVMLLANSGSLLEIIRDSLMIRAEEAIWSGGIRDGDLRRSFTKLFMAFARHRSIQAIDIEALIEFIPYAGSEEDASSLDALQFVILNHESLQISDFVTTLVPRIITIVMTSAFEPSFRVCFSRMMALAYAGAQLIGRGGYSGEMIGLLVREISDKYLLLEVEDVESVCLAMFGEISLEDFEGLMMELVAKAKQIPVSEIIRHLTNQKLRTELFSVK